uniref:Uncharacterized protein n=1 Tax=Oscillatoriales cyanobacterium SpSt-402 TaxID=2282168 RepID=A0A832HA79_9CYAN
MNLEEFRAQTRSALEESLNKLQAATLLLTELETQVTEAGRTIQVLTRIIEDFISVQGDGLPQSQEQGSPEGGTSSEQPSNG